MKIPRSKFKRRILLFAATAIEKFIPKSKFRQHVLRLNVMAILTREVDSTYASLIKTTSETLKRCQAEGVTTSTEALNTTLYIMVLTRDIHCLLRRLWSTNDDWESKLICRHLALAIVEGMEDLAELNGHCLHEFTQNRETWEALKTVSQELNKLRIKHEKNLRQLRVTAVAHRDKDANTLINSVTEVDTEHIAQIGLDLYIILVWVMSPLLTMVQSGCESCKYNKKAESSTSISQTPSAQP